MCSEEFFSIIHIQHNLLNKTSKTLIFHLFHLVNFFYNWFLFINVIEKDLNSELTLLSR